MCLSSYVLYLFNVIYRYRPNGIYLMKDNKDLTAIKLTDSNNHPKLMKNFDNVELYFVKWVLLPLFSILINILKYLTILTYIFYVYQIAILGIHIL